jgi:hypothetical protein
MRILPRRFGEVLGDTISSLGHTWRSLASTSLLVFVPAGAVSVVVFATSGASEFLEVLFTRPGYLENLPREVFFRLARPFLIAAVTSISVQALATLYVYLVAHSLVCAQASGRPATGREARGRAFRRFATGLGSGLLVLVSAGIIIAAGVTAWLVPYLIVGTPSAASEMLAAVLFLILLAPGVWLAVSLSMVTVVVAVEDVGVFGSLRRSRRLVRGRWAPTLAYLLLVGLMGTVAIQLIQLVAIPLSVVGDASVGISLAAVIGVITQGLIVAGIGALYTGWYIDLRARQEVLRADDLIPGFPERHVPPAALPPS